MLTDKKNRVSIIINNRIHREGAVTLALEKTGDILRDAYKNGYGVIATNIFNFETISHTIECADILNKPVIVAFYPGWRTYMPMDVVAETTRLCAARVKVPVGLHLDHCMEYDVLIQAMKAGFNSVMYDGSALPFDENVKNTAEVIKAAKALDIDVEAELGRVGSAAKTSDFEDTSKFTLASDAKKFVELTECSSLAVAVGNAHGNYVRQPKLDIDRIKEIKAAVNIPLVLHGGSGIPDDQVQDAVKAGMAKMNVGTDYHSVYYSAVMEYDKKSDKHKSMFFCSTEIKPQIIKFLEQKIKLLNPGV